MKAYLVYRYDGKYDETYQEYDKRYFLIESSAKDYKKELEPLINHEELGGVNFEEIEITEN
jgi:hypothetical protein